MSSIVHPTHYNSHPSGVEVMEYVRLLPFGPGNAVKYVMRRDHKGKPLEDIDKALYYIEDSLDNNILYPFKSVMRETILPVIAAEPNHIVGGILRALYLPPPGVSILSMKRCEYAYEEARALLEVLRDDYAHGEPPC